MSMAPVVGLVGAIVIVTMMVIAYAPIMGSVANDATANNITTSSHNASYQAGTEVAQGFMGLNQAEIAFLSILIIIVVLMLVFSL